MYINMAAGLAYFIHYIHYTKLHTLLLDTPLLDGPLLDAPPPDLNPTRDFLPRGSGIVTRRPLILQVGWGVATHVVS